MADFSGEDTTSRSGIYAMSSAEARSYVSSSVERLPSQLHEAVAMRELTIESVALLPCWRLRYGGTPQFAARELFKFVVHRRQEI
jgi:hypothetical protein